MMSIGLGIGLIFMMRVNLALCTYIRKNDG